MQLVLYVQNTSMQSPLWLAYTVLSRSHRSREENLNVRFRGYKAKIAHTMGSDLTFSGSMRSDGLGRCCIWLLPPQLYATSKLIRT